MANSRGLAAALLAALGGGACTTSLAPEASTSSAASAGTSAGTTGSSTSAGTSGSSTGGTSSGASSGSSTGSSSGSTTGTPDAGQSPPVWVGIVGTGQSLSVGYYGFPVLSTTQPYNNLKLEDDGPDPRYAFDGGGLYAMVPLVEPIRTQPLPPWADDQYPNNIYGESPQTALADQRTALSLAADAGDLISVQTVVGWSGHCMVDIDKEGGKRAYPGSLAEGRVIAALAVDAGHTLRYDAVVLTHGECDSDNQQYEADLFQLWYDYNADLARITGQDGGVPLIETQQSTVDPIYDGTGSMLSQWRASVDHPGQIVCAGPKYQYSYAPDNLHLRSPGYIRLGEKYGEVVSAFEAGRGWTPLEPLSATHVDNVVTVNFQDSFPPLSWDDNQPQGHQFANQNWDAGRGFEVTDLGTYAELLITSAAISGDSVVLTLGYDPDAGVLPDGGVLLGYAMTTDTPASLAGGLPWGRHGALRDSDPLVGIDSETLPVEVVQGTTAVFGLFPNRAVWDRVSGGALPAETVVLAIDPTSTAITLSQPWTGPSGSAELTFSHEQRNYCVDFQLKLP